MGADDFCIYRINIDLLQRLDIELYDYVVLLEIYITLETEYLRLSEEYIHCTKVTQKQIVDNILTHKSTVSRSFKRLKEKNIIYIKRLNRFEKRYCINSEIKNSLDNIRKSHSYNKDYFIDFAFFLLASTIQQILILSHLWYRNKLKQIPYSYSDVTAKIPIDPKTLSNSMKLFMEMEILKIDENSRIEFLRKPYGIKSSFDFNRVIM